MGARRARSILLAALGAAVVVVVTQTALGISLGFGNVVAAQGPPSAHPNRFDPSTATASVQHPGPAARAATGPTLPFSWPRKPKVPVQPALVRLDPVAGAHFLGSDGMLELSVPPGAVTAEDVKAGGGGLSLLVRQVLPASGSNAGGSGKYSFGTWLVQVVDASGSPARQGLRQRLGVKLHQTSRAGALDLAHVRVLVNQPLPSWVDTSTASVPVKPSQPVSAARQAAPASGAVTQTSASTALGPTSRQPAVLDASAMTLSAAVPASSPSTAVSFGTDAPVATFGRPDPFETDLSAGALSAGIQLDLPAGPGGLTPPLTLAYNSSAVNDQHNPGGAAPWVGEGWSLGLGAVSWAEHQVDRTGCQQCTAVQWEDSWQLSDPFGTAADLVPPDVNVSTYQDDTGNAITASPITWQTAPETRARVISYGNPSPPFSPTPPCFRVFLTNGIMEEFGCTGDSLQYYTQTGGANAGRYYLANWLLDLITDPEGNQVHVTYQRDVETGTGANLYVRDAVPATVEYDSPGCKNSQSMCTGSAWAPLMRVNFTAGHAVAHVQGAGCSANGNLRCDDPLDLSGSSGLPAPIVQSVFVLNDAQVQVRTSGNASWNTLRDYRFSYDQSGPSTITDPVSGAQQSVAGRLLLTQLQVIGADGATALPVRSFGYTPVPEYYEDSMQSPVPSTNCGPSWNNGNTPNGHTGCVLWSQSYAGNGYYLTSVSNGQGLADTFSWQLARNNFHGVNAGAGSPSDPYACNNTSIQSTFPCNMPDDGSWSRVVLTRRQDSVVRLSQSGQGGAQSSTPVTSTWAYTYQVAYPLKGQECSTCVASFYWGNQNDFDALDFYNARFFGFAQATVSLPDGAVEVHKFHTTEGFGIYDTSQSQLVCNTSWPCTDVPYWHLNNAAHGHEYELDRYATDGSTLLGQAKTKWAAVCPPPGVSGTPFNSNWGNWDGDLVAELDHSNPVMVCEVHQAQVDQYTYDGTGVAPVHSAAQYTYDGLGRVASQTRLGVASAADASGHGNLGNLFGGVTEQMPGLISGDSDTAMGFDGSTGTVSLNLAGIDTSSGHQVTVEFWMNWNGSGSYLMPFGFDQYDLFLSAPSGFGFNTGNSDVYGVPTSAVPKNTPVHVVAVFTNGGVGSNKLYFNGVQQSLTQLTGTSLTRSVTAAANISGWPTTAGYDFGGTLDEVAVYNGALPAPRVSAHYGAGAGYRAAVLSDAPLAYYRLDDGGGASPNTIVSKPQYVQNDSVSASSTSATGSYLVDFPAFSDLEDPAGNRYQCGYTSYDGQNFTMGQTSGLTLGRVTMQDRYTSCGTAPNFTPAGQLIRTTSAYDVFGNLVASSDPDANAGSSAHLGCAVGGTSYSSCATYDGTFGVLPTSGANAFNQRSATGYQAGVPTTTTVVDSSGHGLPASWSGGVGFGTGGLVSGDPDTAMSVDGSTGTVGLNLTGIDTTSGHQVTVEFWMNWSGSGGSSQMLFSFNGYDLLLLPGTGLGFNTGNSDLLGVPMSAVPAYTPLHVVGVFTNGGVSSNKLYINGVQQTLTQLLGSPVGRTVSAAANVSGESYYQFLYPFSGTADEVAVYNGALSASRVSAHFNAGAGYRASVLADSPLAYYRLDDDTGAASPLGGFGLWPLTRTDANGQTTSTGYDALGRETSRTLPGEQGGGAPAVIADSSGHATQAVWGGGITFAAPGLVSGDGDTAMSFDGSTGTVGLNLAGIDATSGHQVTVELWMKWSGAGTSQMLYSFNGYDLLLVPGTGLGFNTGNSDLLGVPASAVPANTPLHVVAVFTNGGEGSNSLYINGVQQTLTQLLGSPLTRTVSAAANVSGEAYYQFLYAFTGTLDEVAVYNGVLPSSRVSAHYAAGAGYKAAVLADAPLAYYRLHDTRGAQATVSTAYTVWCSGTAAQTPCVEVDRTRRLNSTTTATSRAFYDGVGRLVETRSPAPGGQDVVRYSYYDPSQRLVFQSVPYFVTAYTGGPGSAAYSIPDSTVAGTSSTYDGLGRVLTATDALSHQGRKTYAVACGPPGTGDTSCYEQTLTIDANGHQGGTLVDGFGRTAYVQRYTGNSPSTYAVYATARYSYDFAGDLTGILQPDSTTTTSFGYDMAGRRTSMTDPDLGVQTHTYDQDGNLVQSVDARGAAGTIFMGYDGLDRPIWRNTTNSPTGAYDTYSYDSTAAGNMGVGRLTSETFSAGALSGSYAYGYDGRGQQTSTTLTVGSSSYPLQTAYDDAGNVLSQHYPDGETVSNTYTAQGWLSSVATTQGSVTLANNIAYTGTGGAFGEITGMHLGGGYDYSATYDLLDRATDLNTKRTSDGTTMFDQARTFDAAGNVSTISSTLPGGTDYQAFCYDEQDRLTWAVTSGTTPCTAAISAGTLPGAQYTNTFTYDVMGRMTSGPVGGYTYGDATHVHGVTAIGNVYTAAYDAAGNMTCRAPSQATTCQGTQTGAQMAYNNEGELQSWQSAPTSPTTTAQYLYDGQGQRVEQVVTQGGTTTNTVYVGDLEEGTTTGSMATTTAYYYALGKRIGLSAGGTISYLAADGLGSANVTLGNGSATASQLFAPYGTVRYSSGTMPTRFAFTGQRADSASGLDYYGARYYDPSAGQFTSGDSVLPGAGLDLWGLSRYTYVEGNPVDRTDPSGHRLICGADGSECGGSTDGMDPLGHAVDDSGHNCLPGCARPPSSDGGRRSTPPASAETPHPTPTSGPAPTPPTVSTSIPVLSGVEALIDAFTSPVPETLMCEPDGACYHWYSAGYRECVQSGRCSVMLRGGVETDVSGPEPTLTFDQAREQAFKLAGMTDPDQVKITKYDPQTGTAVEFSGPNGAKVVYDGPHAQPGPGHDYPHIGWQAGGKRGDPGWARGNIPYKGPAGPVRGSVPGWEEWWPVDEIVP